MTKRTAWLLSMLMGTMVGTTCARAADIQAAPVEKSTPAPAAGDKTSSIGPHDPEQERPLGVGVDVFVTKNLAVSSSLSLLPMELPLAAGQPGTVGGLGLSTARVGGSIGLKVLFD